MRLLVYHLPGHLRPRTTSTLSGRILGPNFQPLRVE